MLLNTSTDELVYSDRDQLLIDLWQHGVDEVRGRVSVKRYFDSVNKASKPYSVIAIGKAANDMMLGAVDALGTSIKSGLVITKYDHLTEELRQQKHMRCYESAHPVPNEDSLASGEALLEFIKKIPANHEVLVLISGGASSLVEVLVPSCDLDQLQELNEWALQVGLNIHEINFMRQQVSHIKGGKLCGYFKQSNVQCLYISDVPEDNVHIIGSGLLCPEANLSELVDSATQALIGEKLFAVLKQAPDKLALANTGSQFSHNVIANNETAQMAVLSEAKLQGLKAVIEKDSIDKDYIEVADTIFESINRISNGVLIWGGEPTVVLPQNPGMGGRNQALALQLAKKIQGSKNIAILVAGTDGTDGPTNAAGALVDGNTCDKAMKKQWNVEDVLNKANAYPCLEDIGSLFSPGPTGTNVMDLIVAFVGNR